MKKLTDKQKSRLWEQQRSVNFQASCLLEKGKGPAEPDIERWNWGLPHRVYPICVLFTAIYSATK
ncbi:YhfG family protein [Enterobacter hormaechei]|uniref:YhfG family protein n=1 Tax=Enterobacter hormaechei TaxID=158836 RepID=UPI0031382A40